MGHILDDNLLLFLRAEKKRISLEYDNLANKDIDPELTISMIKLAELVIIDRCINVHMRNYVEWKMTS